MSDMNDFNATIIAEFRENDGQVGGDFADATMVLLTTTGAKSGATRINPLVCRIDDDGQVYVFASKAGAPTHPDWYHNLTKNPTVGVELGAERFEATAEELSGDERDAVYAAHAKQYPGFAEYQANTDRVIPVIALRRS